MICVDVNFYIGWAFLYDRCSMKESRYTMTGGGLDRGCKRCELQRKYSSSRVVYPKDWKNREDMGNTNKVSDKND